MESARFHLFASCLISSVFSPLRWGSIGLSRRRELYYKEIGFDSLADLVLEFKRSYERVFHTLKRVKVRSLPRCRSLPLRLFVRSARPFTCCCALSEASQSFVGHAGGIANEP